MPTTSQTATSTRVTRPEQVNTRMETAYMSHPLVIMGCQLQPLFDSIAGMFIHHEQTHLKIIVPRWSAESWCRTDLFVVSRQAVYDGWINSGKCLELTNSIMFCWPSHFNKRRCDRLRNHTELQRVSHPTQPILHHWYHHMGQHIWRTNPSTILPLVRQGQLHFPHALLWP